MFPFHNVNLRYPTNVWVRRALINYYVLITMLLWFMAIINENNVIKMKFKLGNSLKT